MAGATGLVGRAVLARLLADKSGRSYTAVHCVGRRAPPQRDLRLVVHRSESLAAFTPPPVDDIYIALGTTLRAAGSRKAFRALDLDAVVALARAGRAAGATRLAVVSAMGADSRSRAFYSRVKGEVEAAVCALGYQTVVIARPSLLAGDRASLGQTPRAGESWALRAAHWLSPLLPANYRPVEARDVAQTLIATLQSAGPGCHVLLSGALHQQR